MAERKTYGLSRRELEREVQWALRQAPQNPDQLPKFFGELMVKLIDKNNIAIAAASAEVEDDFSF